MPPCRVERNADPPAVRKPVRQQSGVSLVVSCTLFLPSMPITQTFGGSPPRVDTYATREPSGETHRLRVAAAGVGGQRARLAAPGAVRRRSRCAHSWLEIASPAKPRRCPIRRHGDAAHAGDTGHRRAARASPATVPVCLVERDARDEGIAAGHIERRIIRRKDQLVVTAASLRATAWWRRFRPTPPRRRCCARRRRRVKATKRPSAAPRRSRVTAERLPASGERSQVAAVDIDEVEGARRFARRRRSA